MSSSPIQIQRTGPVLTLTLSRPAKRNALNRELVEDLTRALIEARSDGSVRVIVLTGEGGSFSAGADLESLRSLQVASRSENEEDSKLMAGLFRTMYTHPRVIVARVNGHAIAGGCGLVAAADFAIAVDTARLGFTEVRIGFVPALVSAVLLRKLRGSDVRRLLLTGGLVTAHEAVDMGLLHAAVPEGELDTAVEELTWELASETSPVSIALTKELLTRVADLDLVSALEYAAEVNVAARLTDDCRAGIAAFLEKKPPPWKMARPDSAE